MKTLLITGGAGFIGSHTADMFLNHGWRVIILDNFSSGKKSNLNHAHPHLKIIEGDVLDFPLLKKIIADCDAVLHLAAISSVPKSLEDPAHTLKINTLGLVYVLQAMHKVQPKARLVYASSAAVYGAAKHLPCDDEAPITEETLSPYALQKIHCEQYAKMYARLFKINSLGLRYFNVYGPRQDAKSPYSGVISRFVEQYAAGEPITIFGDGKQTRDFIFVEEVAKANLLAIESDYCGVLNIATGRQQTLVELVNCIETVGGKTVSIKHLPARTGDIYHSYASVKKAELKIHFCANVSLLEGIERLMVSYGFSLSERAKNDTKTSTSPD